MARRRRCSLPSGPSGSSRLAVYLVGVLLGNSTVQRVDRLSRFHDSLTWLMQIAMFLILGLLVFPARLPAVFVSGLLITGVAVFIARPASVLLSLLPVKMSFREKLFVSWVGLRGAVPIVLATFFLKDVPMATSEAPDEVAVEGERVEDPSTVL